MMRRALGLLGVFIILLLGGKMPVEAQPAKVVPKGKITLAWPSVMNLPRTRRAPRFGSGRALNSTMGSRSRSRT